MSKIIYRVSNQTTLEEIAEKFHTTPLAIARLNNLDGEVFVGMRLLIEPSEGEYYIVQPFDTVASIAKDFGVGEDVIREYNSDRVFIGQKIFICTTKSDKRI
ncbi:MAG: LysM peptidoglycan-binding domain-containing protein [Clostridia bacterium]|nr:LysM peptidoglycan-binding domain-containing protein [Clostridia bacterium]